jgi:uncharacterized protein YjbI with pentapeptide repeats
VRRGEPQVAHWWLGERDPPEDGDARFAGLAPTADQAASRADDGLGHVHGRTLISGFRLVREPPGTVNRMTGGRRELIAFKGDLEPDEDYEGLRFAEATFDEATAGGCHFLDCSFVSVSFSGGLLRKSRFTDDTLREVRFVATDLAETGWQDTTVTGCALAGVQAYSAALRRVVFRDGKLDSVNFRNAVLTDVTFEDCVLRDVDFGGATLLRVSFAGCTLTGADFTKAACTEVDMRGARLGITAGYDSLRGVTIDSAQLVALAPYLARHLGLTVAD